MPHIHALNSVQLTMYSFISNVFILYIYTYTAFYVSPVLYSKFNGNYIYTQNGVHYCKLLFLDNRIFIVSKVITILQ